MSAWRKIIVDGKEYRWAGSSRVVINDSRGRRLFEATAPEIKGITWDEWERGKHKITTDGMMRPSDIVGYIRRTNVRVVRVVRVG